MYRFALRGRWLVGHFVVLTLIGLFILAGFWQLDRLHGRREHNAAVLARGTLPPVELSSVLSPDDTGGGDALYRSVSATGHYDPAHQVIVPFRDFEQEQGEFLLTPLVLDDGSAVIVSRGWIPASDPTLPVPAIAAPPSGTVTVTGLAVASEGGTAPFSGALSESPPSEVAKIDLARLQRALPYDLYPIYIQIRSQDPPQSAGLPAPLPPPELSEGPHFGYAIQWFLFTAIAVIGWPMVLVKQARERARADAPDDPRVAQPTSVD
jgi:cytochrome oxidase assembly protein ShyY1